FHGPLEIVGTIILPGVAGLYLFALPMLDAKWSKLRPQMLLYAGMLGVLALTFVAKGEDAKDESFQKERVRADERANAANRIAMDGVPPDGPLAMMKRAPELRGPELFDKSCAGCHTLGSHGTEKDRTATKLDGWSTEKWILEMIHDPDG